MPLFAFGERGAPGLQAGRQLRGLVGQRAQSHQQVEVAAQDQRHRHLRVVREGGLERAADVAVELQIALDGFVEGLDRLRVGGREFQPFAISLPCHCVLPES
ncbi:hypothetical protein [Bordetella bronchiseptica]|uniref:hypothetical protein n=1 Tax=Bordetella bronchiseptica TaxID=518 RepID=UPI00209C2E11|nr:hypothetical protein [Bordetella bronchiseptica]